MNAELMSPLLDEPGAVAADPPDVGVAAHYGDPYAEQRALASRFGVVDRSNRGVLRITGPDRLSWLHSLTTQHLERLEPGASAEALVLSPQGHVEHHVTLTDDGSAVWAHVEPGTIGSLADFLTSMRFMLRVEPEDVSAQYAVLTVHGPQTPAAAVSAAAGLPGIVISTGFGTDLIVPRTELAVRAAELRSAGAALAGLWAHEALRIAADDPARGRVDRDCGASQQGVLPRPGDSGTRAQPRASSPAARPAAPGWQRGQAAEAR
jgi:tRNA-modifying protein YgfZ